MKVKISLHNWNMNLCSELHVYFRIGRKNHYLNPTILAIDVFLLMYDTDCWKETQLSIREQIRNGTYLRRHPMFDSIPEISSTYFRNCDDITKNKIVLKGFHKGLKEVIIEDKDCPESPTIYRNCARLHRSVIENTVARYIREKFVIGDDVVIEPYWEQTAKERKREEKAQTA